MVLVYRRVWIVVLLTIHGVVVSGQKDLRFYVPEDVVVQQEAHPTFADICHECSGWCSICLCCIIFASNIPLLVNAQPENSTCPIVPPIVPSMDDVKPYQSFNKAVRSLENSRNCLRKRK